MQLELSDPPPACRELTSSHRVDTNSTTAKSKLTRRRNRGRAAILTFASTTLSINFGVLLILNSINPGLRDPEYNRRISQLRARVAENPERPLVLVIGSSRTAMGVRPSEWEACRPARTGSPDPLLFNLSLIGGGPLLELIVLQRALADGAKPAAILFEYWPPLFFNESEDPFGVALDRLGPRDLAVVDTIIELPDSTNRMLSEHRLNPISATRHRLLSQFFPKWIPTKNRVDWMWSDVDGWGWKPGCDFKAGLTKSRTILLNQARESFSRRFREFRIDPGQDRAFREAIALARKSGLEVRLISMPESSEFRSWYPPSVEQAAWEHLKDLRQDFGVKVIDARCWMEDDLFSDGFHLTRIGAAEFTRRLGQVIATSCLKQLGQP